MYTLEKVVEIFNSWRLQRQNRAVPIPNELWLMASALIPNYKQTDIVKSLRISGSQFRKHCINNESKQFKDSIPGFAVGTVMPTLSTPISPNNNEECELILKGQNKSLQIKINIQNITAILPLIEGYL